MVRGKMGSAVRLKVMQTKEVAVKFLTKRIKISKKKVTPENRKKFTFSCV